MDSGESDGNIIVRYERLIQVHFHLIPNHIHAVHPNSIITKISQCFLAIARRTQFLYLMFVIRTPMDHPRVICLVLQVLLVCISICQLSNTGLRHRRPICLPVLATHRSHILRKFIHATLYCIF